MIDDWYGKPISDLTRGELIEALDWCVNKLREYQLSELRHATDPLRGIAPYRDTRKCTGV